MQYVKLAGVWLLLHGTLGSVMFAVTTFLFDFSGGQYRMGPVVMDGFLAVGVFVLASGMLALVKTQPLGTAVRVMLVSAVIAWSIAVVGFAQKPRERGDFLGTWRFCLKSRLGPRFA